LAILSAVGLTSRLKHEVLRPAEKTERICGRRRDLAAENRGDTWNYWTIMVKLRNLQVSWTPLDFSPITHLIRTS
jgi:hypothetical protein